MPFATLNTTWFALIGLLWAGYLFLEGFDFGVAVLTPVVAADETDRRLCLNAVGPVWDGNEVWLIVAGGATFAAFPRWYANLFSGFYLALFIILLALIARGVSFEFRSKSARPGWKATWDVANFAGSLIPAVVWGVAFTNLARGIPLTAGGYYQGNLLGLLRPVAIVGGLASLALFTFHGALFLSLKTSGPIAVRARRSAFGAGTAATLLLAGTVAWVAVDGRPHLAGSAPAALPLALGVGAVAATGAATAMPSRWHGWAFAATGTAIVLAMGAVFARMFPAVLPASNQAAHSLTIAQAASQYNTLSVMTIVAAIFTPFVLAYQGWTYWVFRRRLTRPPSGPASGPSGPAPSAPAAAAADPPGAGTGRLLPTLRTQGEEEGRW